ncbi:hypothetical protein [Rhodobacter ferrooxidans]|uniref:Lipoprotein n=1 Tax=Rhodobacter ferrooxidans TaxID=371731 RepID=C8S059_9RHOB|nr:hypothetical protein [Rhodobacter sp. SW2]EEW25668.1 hypothetical protein Rsw2DRAFT_1437 [Rhodobacter sp. SW2]
MPFVRLILLCSLTLAACGQTPDLGPSPVALGPVPVILPLDQLVAQADAGVITPQIGASVAARAAALRARAAAMRGAVKDPATRADLAAVIARGTA